MQEPGQQWSSYIERYKGGEWSAPIFRDMILADAAARERGNRKLTFLDIGCGGGFDNDATLQQFLAQSSGKYIGIEPDKEMELGSIFTETHRCFFEDAPIEPGSIDIAFAVMVLEHIEKPELFWAKLHNILRKDGVFWGFTMDSRHWFPWASLITKKLHIKDWYLEKLHHRTSLTEKYENYDVFYRSNTPEQIEKFISPFSSGAYLNFSKVGQTDYYFPKKLRWIGRTLDRITITCGLPGSVLAVRVQK